jgi:hypothetical protein
MADKEQVSVLRSGLLLWNEWRRKNAKALVDLSGADLSGVNLKCVTRRADSTFSGPEYDNDPRIHRTRFTNPEESFWVELHTANLAGANLTDADLSTAHLFMVHLNSANLHRANLTGANLDGASVRLANLTDARLGGCNFRRADLEGTNLSGANVDGASFSSARLKATVFGAMDLSTARYLDRAYHRGPSTIGLDTIYLSRGRIPAEFLHKAGVPESFIAYMGALVAAIEPVQFFSCFISYSHSDKQFAACLYEALQKRGIRCWLDEKQLLPGDDIYEQIDRGIRLWDKVLLCCSEGSLLSWWVDNEISAAFAKEQLLMKERGTKTLALIPLDLDGFLFRWENGKAKQVLTRLVADFTDSQADRSKFDEQVERLIAALRIGDAGREIAPPRMM